jgi:hypothetical protein
MGCWTDLQLGGAGFVGQGANETRDSEDNDGDDDDDDGTEGVHNRKPRSFLMLWWFSIHLPVCVTQERENNQQGHSIISG